MMWKFTTRERSARGMEVTSGTDGSGLIWVSFSVGCPERGEWPASERPCGLKVYLRVGCCNCFATTTFPAHLISDTLRRKKVYSF